MSRRLSLAPMICALSLSVFFSHGVWAQSNFAPGVIDHLASPGERTEGNHVKSDAACKALKGRWYEQKGYESLCVLPYPDAGKVCKSSKECVGHCIAPVTNDPVVQGTCQRDDSPDDCGRPHFEHGKVIYFNCD